MEINKLSSNYHVRLLDYNDVNVIYNLCCGNELFYQYHPPFVTKESIMDDMQALPPGKTENDKYYVGYFKGKELAAVLDLILGYPNEKTVYFGFFMVDKVYQGKGIGTQIISECADYLAKLKFEKIRLAIDRGNPQSEAFWTKNGLKKTEEMVKNQESAYIPMERQLFE